MKRLLLLALPALLAGCQKPQAPADDVAPAAPVTTEKAVESAATPAVTPTTVATANRIEFGNAGSVRIIGTLPKHQWTLTSAVDAKGQSIDALLVRPAQPLTLDLKGGRLVVGNACNRMSGGYALRGDRLIIDKLASTMKACADPRLMALDGEIGKRMQGTLGVRLSKGDARHMELKTPAGDVLVFASEETAATKYGSAGERVFLEVAAQTAPCSHPLIPNMQCLQVRELKYDDKGLKVGTPGPFGNFYSTIEGYTHQPGVRNVLRVNRYEIKKPPADAPSQAFVLDMVVESDASGKK